LARTTAWKASGVHGGERALRDRLDELVLRAPGRIHGRAVPACVVHRARQWRNVPAVAIASAGYGRVRSPSYWLVTPGRDHGRHDDDRADQLGEWHRRARGAAQCRRLY